MPSAPTLTYSMPIAESVTAVSSRSLLSISRLKASSANIVIRVGLAMVSSPVAASNRLISLCFRICSRLWAVSVMAPICLAFCMISKLAAMSPKLKFLVFSKSSLLDACSGIWSWRYGLLNDSWLVAMSVRFRLLYSLESASTPVAESVIATSVAPLCSSFPQLPCVGSGSTYYLTNTLSNQSSPPRECNPIFCARFSADV